MGALPGGTPRPPWDPPILQDKIARLSPAAGWQSLCEVDGYWSDYEVFVQLPQEWANVRMRVVLTEMDQQTEVFRKNVSDIEHPILGDGTLTGGTIQGSLFRIQGRAGAKLGVQALNVDAVPLPQGKIYIRATPPECQTADQNDRPQVMPFAARHQFVNAVIDNPGAGIAPVVWEPAPLFAESIIRGDRLFITAIAISSADGNVRSFELQTINIGTAVVTTFRHLLIGGSAAPATQYIETLSFPLRPDKNTLWRIELDGSADNGHRINLSGFVE